MVWHLTTWRRLLINIWYSFSHYIFYMLKFISCNMEIFDHSTSLHLQYLWEQLTYFSIIHYTYLPHQTFAYPKKGTCYVWNYGKMTNTHVSMDQTVTTKPVNYLFIYLFIYWSMYWLSFIYSFTDLFFIYLFILGSQP